MRSNSLKMNGRTDHDDLCECLKKKAIIGVALLNCDRPAQESICRSLMCRSREWLYPEARIRQQKTTKRIISTLLAVHLAVLKIQDDQPNAQTLYFPPSQMLAVRSSVCPRLWLVSRQPWKNFKEGCLLDLWITGEFSALCAPVFYGATRVTRGGRAKTGARADCPLLFA